MERIPDQGFEGKVGLVTPLPPEPGGVATLGGWLMVHSASIGAEYDLFLLKRQDAALAGGRVGASSIRWQISQARSFKRWVQSAPGICHVMVAATGSGLMRDLLYLMLLRRAKVATIVHLQVVKPQLMWWRTAWRLIHRLTELVITPGDYARVSVQALGSTEVRVIANPVRELASRQGERTSAEESRAGIPMILFVGDVGDRKGSLVLIEALAILRAAGTDAMLVLAGREEADSEFVRHSARTKELGLEDRVVMPGAVDELGLARLYRSASVFVLPSRQEGVPLAMIEAMANGVPVVTCRVGGIPGFVTHGSTGFLVERDPKEIAEYIARVIGNPGLGSRLADAAREVVSTKLDPDHLSARWSSAYAAVAAGCDRDEYLQDRVVQ